MRQHKLLLLLLLILCTCSDKNPLPNALFDFTLTKKLSGSEAAEFINKLHGKTVADTRNNIAFYSGEKGNCIIYLTTYNNSISAERYFNRMTKKISQNNPVFTNGNYSNIKNLKIFTTYGMGQTHFVFVKGENLFWISAGTMWAEYFLHNYLKYLNE